MEGRRKSRAAASGARCPACAFAPAIASVIASAPRPNHSVNSTHRGRYVLMGVSGSGKSTIGSAFARALDVDFVEGDQYHPRENVERMARGIALTDEDRAPWLRALADRIAEAMAAGTGLVMTCSALKRSYRDVLRAKAPVGEPRFIFLRGSRALIAERLACRRGHFMPPTLLGSQFAALEEPSPAEDAWVCEISNSPDEIVAALVARVAHDR
jgi:gluconokinase